MYEQIIILLLIMFAFITFGFVYAGLKTLMETIRKTLETSPPKPSPVRDTERTREVPPNASSEPRITDLKVEHHGAGGLLFSTSERNAYTRVTEKQLAKIVEYLLESRLLDRLTPPSQTERRTNIKFSNIELTSSPFSRLVEEVSREDRIQEYSHGSLENSVFEQLRRDPELSLLTNLYRTPRNMTRSRPDNVLVAQEQ